MHEMGSQAGRMAAGSAFFAGKAAAMGETDPQKLAEAATIGAAFTRKGKPTASDFYRPATRREMLEGSSDIFAELDRAVEAKELSPVSAQIAKRFIEKTPGLENDTKVQVLNEIKLATDDILQTEGIAPGTPAIITGKMAVDLSQGDLLRFGIEIYQGNDPTTLIEEFFHRDYATLSLAERREVDRQWDSTESGQDRPRSKSEFYAQEKTREFFETAGYNPPSAMGRFQETIKGLWDRVRGLPGSKGADSLDQIPEYISVGSAHHALYRGKFKDIIDFVEKTSSRQNMKGFYNIRNETGVFHDSVESMAGFPIGPINVRIAPHIVNHVSRSHPEFTARDWSLVENELGSFDIGWSCTPRRTGSLLRKSWKVRRLPLAFRRLSTIQIRIKNVSAWERHLQRAGFI